MSDTPTDVTGPTIAVTLGTIEGVSVRYQWNIVDALRIYEQLAAVFNAKDTLVAKLESDPLLNPGSDAGATPANLPLSTHDAWGRLLGEGDRAKAPGPELSGLTFDETAAVQESVYEDLADRSPEVPCSWQVGLKEYPRAAHLHPHAPRMVITHRDERATVVCHEIAMAVPVVDDGNAPLLDPGRTLRVTLEATVETLLSGPDAP